MGATVMSSLKVVRDDAVLSISLDTPALLRSNLIGNAIACTLFLGVPVILLAPFTTGVAVFIFGLFFVLLVVGIATPRATPWILLNRRANQFLVNNKTLCALDEVAHIRIKRYSGDDPDLEVVLRSGASRLIQSTDFGPTGGHIEEAAGLIAEFLRERHEGGYG